MMHEGQGGAGSTAPRFESKPFSRSALVKLQRAFYRRGDIGAAWGEQVETFHWTNNNFIATFYAETIALIARRSPAPLTVLELGAGHGRFSYLCLKALQAQLGSLSSVALRYVMTDIAPERPAAWRAHDKLAPFVADGVLAFGLFDLTRPDAAELASGQPLRPALAAAGSLVVISNYALSDLASDLFSVEGGRLFERRLRYDREQDAAPRDRQLEALRTARFEFEARPVLPGHYRDQRLNALLESYRESLGQGAFDLPVDVLAAFDYFRACNERLYWFIADEANLAPDHFRGRAPKLVQLDSGLLSNRVNLHALARHVTASGARLCAPEVPNPAFDTYAVVPSDAAAAAAIEARLRGFGPADYVQLYEGCRSAERIRSDALLALLRLGRCDASFIRHFRSKLLYMCSRRGRYYRESLRGLLRACWDNHFDIGESFDTGLYAGRMLRRLGLFDQAIACFGHSLTRFGDAAPTRFYLGRCYQALRRHQDAREQLRRAIELQPGFRRAERALERAAGAE